MTQTFVARKEELRKLSHKLQKALAGKRQICLVSGEAGTGKSTLIHQFSSEAVKDFENVTFLIGTCNDQTGIGDSYLPFRQIMYQSLGDNETAKGHITEQNKTQLRKVLKQSGRALIEIAPELIGTFIPGAGLLASLGKWAAEEKGWFDALKRTAEQSIKHETSIDSSQLMFQYTAYLRKISKEYPLVIILDDLQWADEASITLMFHLIRELEDSPIFFIGMYRPNDIELDRLGERHPLPRILNELKRYHGNIIIDLDRSRLKTGKAFVSAFINSEPNKLNQAFHQRLYKLTEGHALFTVEILKNMKEDGNLVKNGKGEWITSAHLDWDAIPDRVEAVIEERINRLDEDLQKLLAIASVEGQTFTVEVLADIQQTSIQRVARQLSKELCKQHRLIKEVGEVDLPHSHRFLSHFGFTHNLVRQYIYEELSHTERRLFHKSIAEALEELYADDFHLIINQLAHHYLQAGHKSQALSYLVKAAETAANVSNWKQVVTNTTLATNLANSVKTKDLEISAKLSLLKARSNVFGGDQQGSITYYEKAIKAFQALEDEDQLVMALNSYAEFCYKKNLIQKSIGIFKKSTQILANGHNKHLQAHTNRQLSLSYRRIDNYVEGVSLLEKALPVLKDISDYRGLIQCYNSLALIEIYQNGNYEKGSRYYKQAISYLDYTPALTTHAMILDNCAILLKHKGEFSKAINLNRKALKLALSTQHHGSISHRFATLSHILYLQGEYSKAWEKCEQGLIYSDKHHDVLPKTNLRIYGARIQMRIRNYDKAMELLNDAIKMNLVTYMDRIYLISAIVNCHKEKCFHAISLIKNAISAAEKRRSIHPLRYRSYYIIALSNALLTLLKPTHSKIHFKKMMADFKYAIKLCSQKGELINFRYYLEDIAYFDEKNILKPAFDLFDELLE